MRRSKFLHLLIFAHRPRRKRRALSCQCSWCLIVGYTFFLTRNQLLKSLPQLLQLCLRPTFECHVKLGILNLKCVYDFFDELFLRCFLGCISKRRQMVIVAIASFTDNVDVRFHLFDHSWFLLEQLWVLCYLNGIKCLFNAADLKTVAKPCCFGYLRISGGCRRKSKTIGERLQFLRLFQLLLREGVWRCVAILRWITLAHRLSQFFVQRSSGSCKVNSGGANFLINGSNVLSWRETLFLEAVDDHGVVAVSFDVVSLKLHAACDLVQSFKCRVDIVALRPSWWRWSSAWSYGWLAKTGCDAFKRHLLDRRLPMRIWIGKSQWMAGMCYLTDVKLPKYLRLVCRAHQWCLGDFWIVSQLVCSS